MKRIRLGLVLALVGGLAAVGVGGVGPSTADHGGAHLDCSAAFGSTTNYPTMAGDFPWQPVVADFNRDGNADLAVAIDGNTYHDPLGGEVVVMLGDGNGGFQSWNHLFTGEGPKSLAVGDFNEDGNPDLAVANSGGLDNANLALALGDGNGGFTITTYPAPSTGDITSRPMYVVVSDLNADGFDDVVIANFQPPPAGADVTVLMGNGTGGLTQTGNFSTGSGTTSVAVGDFNEDGIPDLVVTNLLGSEVALWLGVGGGNFGSRTTFARGGNPNHVAVSDLNGDGFDDLVVSLFFDAVAVYLGTGTGTFGPPTNYAAGDRPWSSTVADLNGDGIPDLAVANSESDNVSVLLGTGTGSFEAPTHFPTGNTPYSVAVGDFNGDSRPDLAVANHDSSDVSILLNTTECGSTSTSTTTTSTTTSTTTTSTSTTSTSTTSTSTTLVPTTTTTAPPGGVPTNKDQCKDGGWRSFGFKNQGQCVSFANGRR